MDGITFLSAPDLNQDTICVLSLYSTAGSFTAGTSLAVLNLLYLPLVESEYVNTSTDFAFNFKYDRKMLTEGAGAVNGEQFGTSLQGLTAIQFARIDANNATITFTISLSSTIKAFLKAKDATDRNFLIVATPQYAAATAISLTDNNAVIGDVQNYAWDRDDSTLLNAYSDIEFYPYPQITSNYKTDFKGWLTDQAFTRHQILIKQGAKLIDYTITIQAYNSGTGSTFTLEEYAFNFTNLYGTNEEIVLPIENILNFKLANNERNNAQFFRVPALDNAVAGSWFAYEANFAFKIRYEQWRALQEYDIAFTSTPYQKWSVFSKASGWAVRYLVVANIYDSVEDNTTEFDFTADMTIYDSTDSDDGLGNSIVSSVATYLFYPAGPSIGYNATDMFIFNDQTTHMVATFTGDFSMFPPDPAGIGFTGYYGVLYLDIYGSGGETFIDQCSTEEAVVDDSMWMAPATLTVVNATTITVEGDIDPTKFDPSTREFIIYARLGYKNP